MRRCRDGGSSRRTRQGSCRTPIIVGGPRGIGKARPGLSPRAVPAGAGRGGGPDLFGGPPPCARRRRGQPVFSRVARRWPRRSPDHRARHQPEEWKKRDAPPDRGGAQARAAQRDRRRGHARGRNLPAPTAAEGGWRIVIVDNADEHEPQRRQRAVEDPRGAAAERAPPCWSATTPDGCCRRSARAAASWR